MSSGDFNEGGAIEPPPELENVSVIEYSDFVECLNQIVTLHFEEKVTPPAFLEALRKTSNQVENITSQQLLFLFISMECISLNVK